MRQSAVADQRITEQQSIIHTLTVHLSGIKAELKTELQSISGSTDTLRKQISDTTTELNRHKKLLAMAERKLEAFTSELADAQEETIALQDALAASRASQDDLLFLCSEYSKGSESAALDYVRSFSERVLLEREDIIARLASLKDLDRELRSLGIQCLFTAHLYLLSTFSPRPLVYQFTFSFFLSFFLSFSFRYH